jgi:hypothetical protein
VLPAIEAQPRVNARRADGTATGADPLGASDPHDAYLTRSCDKEMMPQLKCVVCKTGLRCPESRSDLIGDLCAVCGSLSEPGADLGEIVGYRESRHALARRPRASRAGVLIRRACRGDHRLTRAYARTSPGSRSKAATLIRSAPKSKRLALAVSAPSRWRRRDRHGRRVRSLSHAPQ